MKVEMELGVNLPKPPQAGTAVPAKSLKSKKTEINQIITQYNQTFKDHPLFTKVDLFSPNRGSRHGENTRKLNRIYDALQTNLTSDNPSQNRDLKSQTKQIIKQLSQFDPSNKTLFGKETTQQKEASAVFLQAAQRGKQVRAQITMSPSMSFEDTIKAFQFINSEAPLTLNQIITLLQKLNAELKQASDDLICKEKMKHMTVQVVAFLKTIEPKDIKASCHPQSSSSNADGTLYSSSDDDLLTRSETDTPLELTPFQLILKLAIFYLDFKDPENQECIKTLVENGVRLPQEFFTTLMGRDPIEQGDWTPEKREKLTWFIKAGMDPDHGMDPNRSGNHYTLLGYMVSGTLAWNTEFAKVLIDNGADVNQIAKVLIDNGADVNQIHVYDYRLLIFCTENEVIKEFLLANKLRTGLDELVKTEKWTDATTNLATRLVQNGADPSLLHIAYTTEAAQFLIDNGADFSKCNSDGFSPLACMMASYSPHAIEIAELLVTQNADVMTQLSISQDSPLLSADSLDKVKFLLEQGVNPHYERPLREGESEETCWVYPRRAIEMAIYRLGKESVSIIEALLDAGVSITKAKAYLDLIDGDPFKKEYVLNVIIPSDENEERVASKTARFDKIKKKINKRIIIDETVALAQKKPSFPSDILQKIIRHRCDQEKIAPFRAPDVLFKDRPEPQTHE